VAPSTVVKTNVCGRQRSLGQGMLLLIYHTQGARKVRGGTSVEFAQSVGTLPLPFVDWQAAINVR